jgi:hypothetical protein
LLAVTQMRQAEAHWLELKLLGCCPTWREM